MLYLYSISMHRFQFRQNTGNKAIIRQTNITEQKGGYISRLDELAAVSERIFNSLQKKRPVNKPLQLSGFGIKTKDIN
ncbi:hypothetical protein L914_16225 [Phytophthora nicotianae]|uniref:Uncharacterized protein n=5 Tax=Phytophthora nicotianae TaxID=4792 RepID=V9ED96_PHYNI|nr:hypothetical protein F443_16870 [Phytophthora nicotianae P1569]ETM37201.1 hypothetical protein L914_16225 [Phytophthora nicotianae]